MRFFTFSIILAALFFATVSCGANDDNAEVGEILAEMRSLILDHYKVPSHVQTNKAAPSKEAAAEAELLDDIRLSPRQARQILDGMKKRWGYELREDRIIPNRTVNYWHFPIKYAFNGSAHTEAEKNVIRAAFQLWVNNTCATFQEYPTRGDIGPHPHLFIVKGAGCSSEVGIEEKEGQHGQELSLAEGCVIPGKIAHEAGHALGLWHEFSRPDRDEHVKIMWQNIIKGKEYNFFLKTPDEDIDPENTGYDVTSLMHYDSLGFSIDSPGKKRVMMPLDVHQLTAIGQRARLQFNDIKRVNFAYNCITLACKPEQLKKPCQNGGYQDPKNCKICRCPPGTAGDDCGGVPVATGEGMTGCGGRMLMEPCSIRTIGIPPYPNPYGEEAHCTWRIKTSAQGLAFAFQSAPDMPCSGADTCYDFVEIRSNLNAIASPGRFFCACGENKGRVVKVDNPDEVIVRFASTTISEHGGAGKRNGFLLNVYATCNTTLASRIPNSCIISNTGFELCNGVSIPVCAASQAEFIDPMTTTTTLSTTSSTTSKPSTTSTSGSSTTAFSSAIFIIALIASKVVEPYRN